MPLLPSVQTAPESPRPAAFRGPRPKRLGQLATRFGLARQVEFWLAEVDPVWSLSEARARVIEIVDETDDVKTFVLEPNRHFGRHRAGQFTSVTVEIAGVRHTRCYSLSSAPSAPFPTITVKRVAGGLLSNFLHDQVRLGDILGLGPPMGEFNLPRPTPQKLLFIAGGSGITPIMSMLRQLSEGHGVRDVILVVAARSPKDVIFFAELQRLVLRHRGLRVTWVLDDVAGLRERPSVAEGRVDSALLDRVVPDLGERATYLCGPAPMMDELAELWRERGVAAQLKVERFGGLGPRGATTTLPQRQVVRLPRVRPGTRTVHLEVSGRSVDAAHETTLLEQLEAAGERPAHGCRMGICNSCRCTKRSGVVEDVRTGARTGAGEEDIRLCVSRPVTDVELAL